MAYYEYVRIHKGIEIIIPEVYSKWLLFEVATGFSLLPTSSTAVRSWLCGISCHVIFKIRGQRLVFLLPQAAALSGSGTGSNGIDLASSFIIKNHQTTYSMSCPMQAVRHAFKTRSVVCSMAPQSQSGIVARPHRAWMNGIARLQSAGD